MLGNIYDELIRIRVLMDICPTQAKQEISVMIKQIREKIIK